MAKQMDLISAQQIAEAEDLHYNYVLLLMRQKKAPKPKLVIGRTNLFDVKEAGDYMAKRPRK